MYNTKKEAISEILDIEGIEDKITKWNLLVKVTYTDIINALSKESYTLNIELGVSAGTGVSIVHTLWPTKPRGNIKVCTWLFSKYDLKYCSHCKKVKELDLFSKNASKSTGYNSHCKECYLETTRDYQREYQKTRKALKLSRVPTWADLEKIKEIYSNCPEGFHVDHIVPLQGKLVSGLHVETNLQYLTAYDNLVKGNKY